MVPPLALDSGDVPAEVDIVGELLEARRLPRPGRHLAGVRELVHVARAAVGAGEEKRDGGASGGSPLGKRYCHFHGGRAVPQPGRGHSPDGPGVSLGVASPRFCNGISFWEIIARQHPSPKRSLQMAVVERGPTQVQRVLAKGPIADPFATLEEARNDPDRLEKIRQIRKLIDERGIKYVFFQQVSVSGHVNGKGVVATQWE